MYTLTQRQIEDLIRGIDIIGKSPKAYDLLKWASTELDFTKVSAQQDLTRWLREVVRKESEKIGVTEKEFAKRFRGMIKFFTNPQLGLSAIREIQNDVAETMVSDIVEAVKSAKDVEDLQRLYIEYKDKKLPPLAEAKYQQAFDAELRKVRSIIARVVKQPEYKMILDALKEAKEMVANNKYKKASIVELTGVLAHLREASKISSDLQRELNLPLKINKKSINRYIRLFEREIQSRRVLRRRPLKRVLRRRPLGRVIRRVA